MRHNNERHIGLPTFFVGGPAYPTFFRPIVSPPRASESNAVYHTWCSNCGSILPKMVWPPSGRVMTESDSEYRFAQPAARRLRHLTSKKELTYVRIAAGTSNCSCFSVSPGCTAT